MNTHEQIDLLVVGAGGAGLMTAITAARKGKRILLIDLAPMIGGTLRIAGGHLSAAGTRVQAQRGIVDSADLHYQDVMRISRGTADPDMVRIAVDNAADTLHWLLDNGFDLTPGHPVIYPGHESYTIARTYWGVEGGRSVLTVLEHALAPCIDSGRVRLQCETELIGLNPQADGFEALLKTRDGVERVTASDVVLASGGFAGNAALLARYSNGARPAPEGNVYSQGGGLLVALSVGATLVNQDKTLAGVGVVTDPRNPNLERSLTMMMPHLRAPWEILVDPHGRRFVGEDDTRYDAGPRALMRLGPDLTCWVLWDAAIAAEAPSLFRDICPEAIASAWNRIPGYVCADDLNALAARCCFDSVALDETVREYNQAVLSQQDRLGRKHLPRTLSTPPFYALRHRGASVLSFAGVAIDVSLRLRDAHGCPIPHLYAAGEILGHGLFSGQAYAGGMAITPALTFGRLIGERLGSMA